MRTTYLIDLENVQQHGLHGISMLPETDRVYVFFTNNPRLGLCSLANSVAALHLIGVPGGSQSLDMHLVSFLGYLIGRGGEDERFVIVSNDTDFDPPAAFWNKRFGSYKVTRQSAIVEWRHEETMPAAEPEDEQEPAEEPAPAPVHAPRPAPVQEAKQTKPALEQHPVKPMQVGTVLASNEAQPAQEAMPPKQEETPALPRPVSRKDRSRNRRRRHQRNGQNVQAAAQNETKPALEPDPEAAAEPEAEQPEQTMPAEPVSEEPAPAATEAPAEPVSAEPEETIREEPAEAADVPEEPAPEEPVIAAPEAEDQPAETQEEPAEEPKTAAEPTAPEEPAAPAVEDGASEDPQEPARTAGAVRFERNARVMKALAAAGYDQAQTGAVSSLIAKIDREEKNANLKLAVYHRLVHTYGRTEGKKLYDTVKPAIDEPKA